VALQVSKSVITSDEKHSVLYPEKYELAVC
jgi:hypothetical protein